MFDDTIVAIATPHGNAGIGIVRMTGNESFSIANKIFERSDKKSVFEMKNHSINYGWIVDPQKNLIIDEVLLSVFKAPRTYTREDMIEINCHGGLIPLKKTLELAINFGARIAEPGEFTKRAFLNGRIDLSQAEAVLEIIKTKTNKGLSLAIKSLKGSLSKRITELREKLLNILISLNIEIDFEIESKNYAIRKKFDVEPLLNDLNNLIENYKKSKMNSDGMKIAFCGKPNVGKSTIVNTIYEENRILTSEIPGTTRDYIQLECYFEEKKFFIIDTAGIRKERSRLEKLSIERSKNVIKEADIIVFVFDNSRRIDDNDIKIIDWLKSLKKEVIWVINKCDLNEKIKFENIQKIIHNVEYIKISAKTKNGIDQLKMRIQQDTTKLYETCDDFVLINIRQLEQLNLVKNSLMRFKELRKNLWSEEIQAEEIKNALYELDKITGIVNNSDTLEKIFNQFCIGK